MTTKTLLSLATVSLLAFAVKAYTVETTNSWFSVKASEVDLDKSWGTVKPTTKENSLIKVDTEAGSPALYTMPAQSKPSATRYRVTGKMKVTLNAGEPAAFTVAPLPKAALVAASVGGDKKWYAWHLTGESAGAWVAMNGATPTDDEEKEYDITIEFTSSEITYYVDGTALTHGEPPSTTTVLSNAGGKNLSMVGLAGYGSFGDFGALGFDSFTVTVTLTEEQKKAMGITDISSATLNEKGANGLTKWESIVLGLPDSSTKPYTAPVQTNNGKLGFTIGNVNTSNYGASGASVTFDVIELSGPNEKTGKTVSSDNTAGSTATVDAPDANDGVKYYKIKIKFQ